MKDILDLIGRMLLAAYFYYEAYDSIFYYKETVEKMAYYGLSWNQEWLVVSSIVLIILGTTFVLLGYRTTLGAALLLLYFVPLTFIVHDFWSVPKDFQEILPVLTEREFVRMQGLLFVKNLAIIGGLFMVYVNDSRKYRIRRIFATSRVPGA